jgi:hypothetical protein
MLIFRLMSLGYPLMRLQATSSRLAPVHLPLFLGLHPQATAHEATTLKLLGALWSMPLPTLTLVPCTFLHVIGFMVGECRVVQGKDFAIPKNWG